MGKHNKATNKQRDEAIGRLYQAMDAIAQRLEGIAQGLDYVHKRQEHYIDWRRDGKRYRRHLEKEAAKIEKERIAKSKTKPDGAQEAPTTIEEGVVE